MSTLVPILYAKTIKTNQWDFHKHLTQIGQGVTLTQDKVQFESFSPLTYIPMFSQTRFSFPKLNKHVQQQGGLFNSQI